MSESQHTPGPWKLKVYPGFPGDGVVYGVIGPESAIIALTTEADANLIAAAPDLLEALEWVIADVSDPEGLMIISTASRHKAKTAIAKAKGESE